MLIQIITYNIFGMMSGIQEIKNILEKESYLIEERREVSLSSDKNGVINDIELEINKLFLITEALVDAATLVDSKLGYPTKDKRKADITADLVILKGEDYRELISLLDGIE